VLGRINLGKLAPGAAARLNVAADLTLLQVAIQIATRTGNTGDPGLLVFAATSASLWILLSTALRHYAPASLSRGRTDDAALVTVHVMALATVLAVVRLLVPHASALPEVGLFTLFLLPALLTVRLFLFRPIAKQEQHTDEVLVLGIGPIGRLTGQDLDRKGRRKVLGYLQFADEGSSDAQLLRRVSKEPNLLGTSDDLESILRTMAVSEVYIAGNVRKHMDEMQASIRSCEKLGIPFAHPAYGFRMDRARPTNADITDGYIHYVPFEVKPQQLALKRLFDIASSGLALWVLSPLFFAVTLAIKLTSRGPVFFRQVRVGLHGRKFNMLKFRSMVVNAEELKERLAARNEQTGPVFKMKDDPRITRIGKFIRKYSIDELPQLINVLRGDMSVVGPRPPVPAEVAKYEAWQIRRLSVRPGLTCIWQVSGRNQITFEKWMYLDLQYIDHWSLSGDFNLILKTFPVVITGRGAS